MADFKEGVTPPVRENASLRERAEQAKKEAQFADAMIEMMLKFDTDPEHRTGLLILKTGHEVVDRTHLLIEQVNKDISLEKKQEILEYLTAVKGGLETFIETSNFKSEE